VEFHIEVSAQDTSAEDIDWMTRQLLSELRELDIESVELTKGGIAPAGSKGDPITLGSIAIQVLPAVLPSIIGLVQSWASRGQGRTVKFKARGIEFEGSPEEFQQLMEALAKGKKNK
jgi:hypothetical protein